MADPANAGRDLSGIDYALVWKQHPALFERAKDVKAIFSGGAGVDHILRVGGLPEDVPLVRFVDRSLTDRMSEWVVLQCLLHLRQMPAYLKAQAERHWEELAQPEARDVTVGVMGLGVLGQDAARKLKVMGFHVVGWSRSAKAIEGMQTFDGEGLNDFLAQTDILVGLLPLTAETRGIYNKALFAKLKQGGRGASRSSSMPGAAAARSRRIFWRRWMTAQSAARRWMSSRQSRFRQKVRFGLSRT